MCQLAFSNSFIPTGRPKVPLDKYWDNITRTRMYFNDQDHIYPPFEYYLKDRTCAFCLYMVNISIPAIASINALTCFLNSKDKDSQRTQCETLFKYTNEDEADAFKNCVSIAVKQTAAFLTLCESVTAVSDRALEGISHKMTPTTTSESLLHTVVHNFARNTMLPLQPYTSSGGTLALANGRSTTAAEAAVHIDEEDESLHTKYAKQQVARRQATCEAIFACARTQNTSSFAKLSKALSKGLHPLAKAFLANLRNTKHYTSAVDASDFESVMMDATRVMQQQHTELSELDQSHFNHILHLINQGLLLTINDVAYKVQVETGTDPDFCLQLLNDDHGVCGEPPQIKYRGQDCRETYQTITTVPLTQSNGFMLRALCEYLTKFGVLVNISGEAEAVSQSQPLDTEVEDLRAKYKALLAEAEQKARDLEVENQTLKEQMDISLTNAAQDVEIATNAMYITMAHELLVNITKMPLDHMSSCKDRDRAINKLLLHHIKTSQRVTWTDAAGITCKTIFSVSSILSAVRQQTIGSPVACQLIAHLVASIYAVGESLNNNVIVFKEAVIKHGKVEEYNGYPMTPLTATMFFVIFPEEFIGLFMPSTLFGTQSFLYNYELLTTKCSVCLVGSADKKSFAEPRQKGWAVFNTAKNAQEGNDVKFLLCERLDRFMINYEVFSDALPLPEHTCIAGVQRVEDHEEAFMEEGKRQLRSSAANQERARVANAKALAAAAMPTTNAKRPATRAAADAAAGGGAGQDQHAKSHKK
jgi:hypothetical protein